ncbi:CRISPR-associated protein Csx16 [Suttonella indologenes]|uniref:Putative CRISPR-associated protein, VVA1548 family n=1 Tax=Suttonella indologenes TaxID=13276 RepID=A0A380MJK1_9GAMM|nr:CRISPR-associated protein Csx16 [Suttonella indologenes]SUO91293.1 putative CRISPR-associated protein, VVA1548 family [Suttonella indologenes]SUO98672.1 putative CRISPR-associated protein, VVA1548 family [Suttonella indologenes]
MTVWFVSRHQGAIDWIAEQKLWQVDRVVPHLAVEEINAGDVVLGTLPVHLAAQVCERGARFYFLQMPQSLAMRGSEFSAQEMREAGASLQAFDVRKLKA